MLSKWLHCSEALPSSSGGLCFFQATWWVSNSPLQLGSFKRDPLYQLLFTVRKVNLVSFRDFLESLSCSPPEIKKIPCMMQCFTSTQSILLFISFLISTVSVASLQGRGLSQRKLLHSSKKVSMGFESVCRIKPALPNRTASLWSFTEFRKLSKPRC